TAASSHVTSTRQISKGRSTSRLIAVAWSAATSSSNAVSSAFVIISVRRAGEPLQTNSRAVGAESRGVAGAITDMAIDPSNGEGGARGDETAEGREQRQCAVRRGRANS